MGPAKACKLIFLGIVIDAKEAQVIGLIKLFVPAKHLQEAIHEMVRNLAGGPPMAIGIPKMMSYGAFLQRVRVHDLKHLYGRRLRAEGVEPGARDFLN